MSEHATSTRGTMRWGVTHIQWGVIMNLGGVLMVLSLLDWKTASLVLGFIAAFMFCVGFWMFFGTLEDRSVDTESDQ